MTAVAPRQRSPRSGEATPLSAKEARVLELLGKHRLLTADLLAQASGASARSAQGWLRRLEAAGLVACGRTWRPEGSAPLHWWLTSAGRAAIGRRGRDRSHQLTPLFVGHTLATAAFAIALDRLGPQVGLRLLGWQWDRDGWEFWPTIHGRWSITPDGRGDVAVTLPGEADVVLPLMVEIDRDSSGTDELGCKVRRYLAYTAAGVWKEHHDRCPVLLLLTTSAERAKNALAAAAKERTQGRFGWAGELLVGVSPAVDDPAAAVLEPVWRSEDSEKPRTLQELLLYRIANERELLAEQAAEAARRQAQLREAQITRLIHTWRTLRMRIPNESDAFLLAALLDRTEDGVAAWVHTHPELAEQLFAWSETDRTGPLPAALREHAGLLMQSQWTALVAAEAAIAANDPRWRAAARSLLENHRAVPGWLIEELAEPLDGAACQATLLDGYADRRRDAVDAALAERRRWQRTAASRQELEDAYDAQNLRTCWGCRLHHPVREGRDRDRCRYCRGALGAYRPGAPDGTAVLLASLTMAMPL